MKADFRINVKQKERAKQVGAKIKIVENETHKIFTQMHHQKEAD